jgi:hypothetical protein
MSAFQEEGGHGERLLAVIITEAKSMFSVSEIGTIHSIS